MYGLADDVIKNIQEIFSNHSEISKVVLYGSRAKGNYREGSDIDITIYGKDLSLQTIYALDEELDELYLPYLFDISIFSHIEDKDLIEHINRVGKVFYELNNSRS